MALTCWPICASASDVALLIVNRLKTNIFFINVPLKLLPPEEFFSPKCTKYRLVAEVRLDALGELTALPPQTPQAGFKGAYF